MAQVFTDSDFNKEVLQSDVPVLVDFWAPWCGPCKIQGPIIDELAQENSAKGIKIGKMNVDENPETPGKFQIMSIPTLIIFKDGEPISQMVGLQRKESLQETIDELTQ